MASLLIGPIIAHEDADIYSSLIFVKYNMRERNM